jgi:hypothetical protein
MRWSILKNAPLVIADRSRLVVFTQIASMLKDIVRMMPGEELSLEK